MSELRVHHFHVRKTAGSSLNAAFQILGDEVIFSSSHTPAHRVDLPENTFAITILRDPLTRVLSYYRYLLWAREDPAADALDDWAEEVRNESFFLDGGIPYLTRELKLIKTQSAIRELGPGQFVTRLARFRRREGGIGDLMARIPPRRLHNQIYMFSEHMDPVEAAEAVLACDAVLFTESFSDDLARLADRLGVNLESKHERRFGRTVEITDAERVLLRERLAPEYQMIQLVREGL